MKLERADLFSALTALAVIAGAALSFLWLTRSGPPDYELQVDYDRVDGMAEGAPVLLQGFQVGEVRDITPTVVAGAIVFRVRLGIRERVGGGEPLALPRGTVANLSYPPLLGSPFVVLEPPPRPGAPLEDGERVPGVRSVRPVDRLQDRVDTVSAALATTMAAARLTMDSVLATVSAMERALGAVEGTVAGVGGEVPRLVEAAERQLAEAALLTHEVRSGLDLTVPRVHAALDSASAALSGSRQLMDRLDRVMGEQGPEVERVLANLDSASFYLNHLVREISERPIRIFTGVKAPPPFPEPGLSHLARGDSVEGRPKQGG